MDERMGYPHWGSAGSWDTVMALNVNKLQFLCLQHGDSESESEVAQSCLNLRDPVDCRTPGSSICGISQARILEWVAISFSRGSS